MAGPLLETHRLTKRFGGVTAVNEVDFVLDEGELRCVIGPNGAGKTTFFKLLTGQHRPDGGSIHFGGMDVTAASRGQIARLGIGIKMQVPSVFDGLPVRENLRLSARRRCGRQESREVVNDTLEKLEIAELAELVVGTLSHGQRQQVELALVLASDPKLILLDEPTAGMTTVEVRHTARLILEIARSRSIVVVEHDMNFIKMIARKVTVFHQGSVFAEDSIDNILRSPEVRDIYLGRKSAA